VTGFDDTWEEGARRRSAARFWKAPAGRFVAHAAVVQLRLGPARLLPLADGISSRQRRFRPVHLPQQRPPCRFRPAALRRPAGAQSPSQTLAGGDFQPRAIRRAGRRDARRAHGLAGNAGASGARLSAQAVRPTGTAGGGTGGEYVGRAVAGALRRTDTGRHRLPDLHQAGESGLFGARAHGAQSRRADGNDPLRRLGAVGDPASGRTLRAHRQPRVCRQPAVRIG
jgi:hypothetical protein